MVNKKIIVTYEEEQYDLTNFIKLHPGGIGTIQHLSGYDISNKLKTPVKHSEAALYLMQEYKINVNNNNTLEHLVDWSKPMIPQIGKLGKQYSTWVNLPVDKPLRLFGPDWLEMLTKTPWWAVPLFWVPCILYLMGLGGALESDYLSLLLTMMSGAFVWTLVEYSLHRWLFHADPTGDSTIKATMHFLIHGLHHKVPFDAMRLVFPPFPAFLLASVLYQPVRMIFPNPPLIMAGALTGYVCYDMIHFYLHYGSPGETGAGSYLYNLKRYHHQHHFVHHDQGFGISSQMWDIVFGTRIFLRKLGFSLKW